MSEIVRSSLYVDILFNYLFFSIFSSFIPVFFLLLLFITVQGSFYLKQFGLLKTRQRRTEEGIEQRNQTEKYLITDPVLPHPNPILGSGTDSQHLGRLSDVNDLSNYNFDNFHSSLINNSLRMNSL